MAGAGTVTDAPAAAAAAAVAVTGDSDLAIFLRSITGEGDRLPDWLLFTVRLGPPLFPELPLPELPPLPPVFAPPRRPS